MITKYLLALSLVAFVSVGAFGATIAVIDSGTDYQHVKLAPHMVKNYVELPENGSDNDNNGYADDVWGWNFAENNNQVIDYKYLGTFSEDVYTFFEIQLKVFLGTITEEDKTWVKEKLEDQEFIKQLGTFGNFVHGTHVSGIAVDQSNVNKIIAIKLLATSNEGSMDPDAEALNKDYAYAVSKGLPQMAMMKFLLGQMAKRQMDLLKTVGKYVNARQAEIANGSFGISFANAVEIVYQIYVSAFNKEPTPQEAVELTFYFLNECLRLGKDFVGAAPHTLFVFAAGNDEDGSGIGDNDKYPNSPCNIDADNVVSVAATIGFSKLAPFSNTGRTKVDVAAPGVGILSSIPSENHDQLFAISGTSQAAPYVANVAGEIKTANTKLSPKDIKRILVETVDAKGFLAGKVRSGGVVNRDRAIMAAQNSRSMNLAMAIQEAKRSVRDQREEGIVKSMGDENLDLIYVQPLPRFIR